MNNANKTFLLLALISGTDIQAKSLYTSILESNKKNNIVALTAIKLENSFNAIYSRPEIIVNFPAINLEVMAGYLEFGVARITCRSFSVPSKGSGDEFVQPLADIDINYSVQRDYSIELTNITAGKVTEIKFNDTLDNINQSNKELRSALEKHSQ